MAKRTVEECLVLDALELAREGVLSSEKSHRITWRRAGAVAGAARLTPGAPEDSVLYVSMLSPVSWEADFFYPILLRCSITSFGAKRVSFLCPSCNGSSRKLYLPRGEHTFLCRSCHDLTYKSRQRRPSLYEKNWVLLPQLAEELATCRLGSKRRERAIRKFEKLRSELTKNLSGDMDRLAEGLARLGLPRLPDLAKLDEPPAQEGPARRPRGRPKEKRAYVRTRPFLTTTRNSQSERLCMKCRDWREPENPVPITLANGRAALRGTCPVCGSAMVTIVKAGS